jgi:hypothetical protein
VSYRGRSVEVSANDRGTEFRASQQTGAERSRGFRQEDATADDVILLSRKWLSTLMESWPRIVVYGGLAIEARDLTLMCDEAKRKLKAAWNPQQANWDSDMIADERLWEALATPFRTQRRLSAIVRNVTGEVLEEGVSRALEAVDTALDAAQTTLNDAQAFTRRHTADENATVLGGALDTIWKELQDLTRSSRQLFDEAVKELQGSVDIVKDSLASTESDSRRLVVRNTQAYPEYGSSSGTGPEPNPDRDESAVNPAGDAGTYLRLPTGRRSDRQGTQR